MRIHIYEYEQWPAYGLKFPDDEGIQDYADAYEFWDVPDHVALRWRQVRDEWRAVLNELEREFIRRDQEEMNAAAAQ